jgi:hypothetical protein
MMNTTASAPEWHSLDKVFAEVFTRPMPETDSEALRFILMEVQSLTLVETKHTNELLAEILTELRGDSKRPHRERRRLEYCQE